MNYLINGREKKKKEEKIRVKKMDANLQQQPTATGTTHSSVLKN